MIISEDYAVCIYIQLNRFKIKKSNKHENNTQKIIYIKTNT